MHLKGNVWWLRDARNPILPPLADSAYDCGCCMNPWVVRLGDAYHLYYAGADRQGRRRICLAIAPVAEPTRWERLGPVLEPGPPGAFDAHWTVLPHMIEIEPGRYHLYYTGNCGQGAGLSAFPGIGVAFSTDGRTWEKYAGNPILARTGRDGDPDAQGIAGGSVLKVRLTDGQTEWRFYYTGCPTLGDDLFRHQQKNCCLAVSRDGVAWEKRGVVLARDPEREYENVAVAGPVVRQTADGGFRMWFSAIGTRWGAYAIGYAESDDGLTWRRGRRDGDDLQLGPSPRSVWEWQMVEYPSVVEEAGRLRLFYCGNGYGATGIGTAVASPLRATVGEGSCRLDLVAAEAGATWRYRLPEGLHCDEGVFKIHDAPQVVWHGPTADGLLWHEWRTNEDEAARFNKHPDYAWLKLSFIVGVDYRVLVNHTEQGLALAVTVHNFSDRTFHNVIAFPCLGGMSGAFLDPRLDRTFIVTDRGLTPLRETDRGGGDPIRAHYHVRGRRPLRHYTPAFWGEPSATFAEEGVILRTSADGRFTIGTSWDDVSELFQNGDSNACIHSVPTLGDLPPGATRTVKGRIVLLAADAAATLRVLRETRVP